MKMQRKHYTPEEKVAILRRHMVEGVPISDLRDDQGLQPTVFYRWQNESCRPFSRISSISSAIMHTLCRVCMGLPQGVEFVRTRCPIYIAGTRHRILPRGPFLLGVLDRSATE